MNVVDVTTATAHTLRIRRARSFAFPDSIVHDPAAESNALAAASHPGFLDP